MQEIARQWPRRGADTPTAVLAHRGAGPGRENTLESFAAALGAGADGVELDVRCSASGTAVVLHDAEVPGMGPLHLLEDAELPVWLPTLEEALATCAGAVVDVEVKGSPADGVGVPPAEHVAAVVAGVVGEALAGPAAPSRVFVSSFWPPALEAVRTARPELRTGLLVHPALDAADALAMAADLGASVLLPFRAQVDGALVRSAHDRGIAVWAWTVNERADLDAVGGAGVDGVITDRVDLALEVLRDPPAS